MRVALHQSGNEVLRDRIGDRFLLVLALALLGYALAGRGFAYAGVPPIFVGEAVLGFGIVAFALTRGWSSVMRRPQIMAILPLAILGFVRLIPGIGQYGIAAIRDAVIWGYAAFALVVATLIIAKPERLAKLVTYYRRFTKIFLLCMPVIFLVYRFAGDAIPVWPGVGLRIIQEKEGDVLVHLSGILAFWMADPKFKVKWILATLLTVNMALMGVIDRAGLLSFGSVMVLCLIAKPRHEAAWRTISMLLCGVIVLWASSFRLEVPGGKGREISIEQFVESFRSIFGHGKSEGSESNKEWRLKWWGEIIDYTFYGPYFWTGKGFGVNLADDDGFQVSSDKSLRSPHNIHMNVLARMGVPGLLLWTMMHLAWLYGVGDAYLRSRRRGDANWCGLFLWLFAYYLAFMINGSFDVFIEGPMGGVWFWTIYGTGVGALWTYRRRRDIFAEAVMEAEPYDRGLEMVDERESLAVAVR
jgi:hypothetical protein